MQENDFEQPPSLSQLLRESYLAEARAQQRRGEMSHSDSASSRFQVFLPLKGKAEDAEGQQDGQFPDLSAFLSQEELDKSVDLAQQAIGKKPQEGEVKGPATTLTPSNSSSSSVLPSVVPPTQPVGPEPSTEGQKTAGTHTRFTSERKMHKSPARQDGLYRNVGNSTEEFNDRQAKVPYNLETQSKKEFLNKAADFIEELSSLFKANSSKRIRPRTCKAHRSRAPSKAQGEELGGPISADDRERAVIPVEVERNRCSPPVSNLPPVPRGSDHTDLQEHRSKEELDGAASQEPEEPAECLASTDAPFQSETVCEPPRFLQKLKSREVLEGTKVQLDCNVAGHPVPEVRWFCEGKELENSPDIQILASGQRHSLIIAEAFEEDTGRYSCFASNVYGTDSTSAEIYVEGASSSDSDVEPLFEHAAQLQRKPYKASGCRPSPARPPPAEKEPEAAAGEPAEKLSDKPEPIVPAQIPTKPPVIPHPSETSAAPPQETVFSAPSGVPAEEASSSATPTGTSGPLHPAVSSVQLLPRLAPDHGGQQASGGTLVMAAPVFTKNLQDLTASQGQLVVLECRVKGGPSLRVDWFREGKVLEDSPDFRILQKKPRSPAEPEEICTLVIAEVFAEDSGMFTCIASNKYGTVSSSAALKVKGDGSNITHVRPLSGSLLVPGPVPEGPPSVNEVTVSSSIKPHASTVRLDPLVSSAIRLDPPTINHFHLEPHGPPLSGPDPHRTSLPVSSPAVSLDPGSVNLESPGLSRTHQGGLSIRKVFPHATPSSCFAAAGTPSEQGGPRPPETLKHQNQSGTAVSLPDPPPNSCLKTGTLTNHKEPRSGSRVGLRVHFKLPEEEEGESSSDSEKDPLLASAGKEPPPVLAKPKLDPSQLQLLHNQVLMEQQQDAEPRPPTRPPPQPPAVPQPGCYRESPMWSPRMQGDPQVPVFQSFMSTTQQISGPPPTPSTPAPALTTTASPPFKPSPAPHVTSPPPVPLLSSAPALSTPPAGQSGTIHASHLNLSPAALSRTALTPAFSSPHAPKLSILPPDLNSQQISSPAAVLRSAHASLMNLTSLSSTFNYARPKEFIAAQAQSPILSPSPTESPVPLLQELAAELNSSAASSPIPPPFSPTRVLKSPTSPPSLVSSPTPGSFLNSTSLLRAQSPPQASSPTSSSSTPSPIQNPVAFLSSVLPSLTPSQPTNSMGLPKGAPLGVQRRAPKVRLPSAGNIRESKELLLSDLEKLHLKDSTPRAEHVQKLSVEGETASRLLGPNIPATVFNYDEEYKVSNFEQRLMSEIEFRLERTPVEESDEEVQHADIPSGRCIAPIFEKKLKNFKALEGVPVTFSCKVVGVPPPKVYWFKDGKQILRKNTHYKKMREGDGTCALHIDSTTSDDDGNYTVMVANPQGRISCSGHLIVQSGPPRHRLAPNPQRVRSRVQEVEGEQTQERFFRPHFLQAPGDMMAHEGRLCRLDCKVSGLPNPELMWLVNGKPIYPDLTHKMLVRENSVHSLVIDPLTQNDQGTYTCIASNKAGQSSFSLELKVVEKETKHAPQFVEKLQNMGIPEGSPVRLECRVVGVPPPLIFWKKDNETVAQTKDRISMTQDATGYVCLLIQTTSKDDAGWYTVSAKNEAGIISCTCRLDIYAQWHQSVPPPVRKPPRTGSRYAALMGQGLDVKCAFPTSDTSPILFASSPPEATLESEEL